MRISSTQVLLLGVFGVFALSQTCPVLSFAPVITSIRKSPPTTSTTPAKKKRHVLKTSSSSSSTPRESLANTNKSQQQKGRSATNQLKKIMKTVLPLAAGIVLFKTTALPTSLPQMFTYTAIRSSSNAFLSAINSFFLSFPYIAAFTVCGFKAALADFVAQRSALSSSSDKATSASGQAKVTQATFEYRRNIAFLFYGGAYQGCVQEYIFNHIFPFLFGSSTDILTVFIKVTTDMLILSPFLCLPVAYIIKGFIYKQSIDKSIRRYIFDVKENMLLTKYWMLWGPVQFLTFGIIPEHFRIGWIAFISFFWLIILSSISGKKASV